MVSLLNEPSVLEKDSSTVRCSFSWLFGFPWYNWYIEWRLLNESGHCCQMDISTVLMQVVGDVDQKFLTLLLGSYFANMIFSTSQENAFPHLRFSYLEHDLYADK